MLSIKEAFEKQTKAIAEQGKKIDPVTNRNKRLSN